jgi:hypothetical protein
MTTAMLVHHLLAMFAHCPRVHWSLTAFYRHQQPGMPGAWYPAYIRALIRYYPHAMQSCAASFHGYAATAQSRRACP